MPGRSEGGSLVALTKIECSVMQYAAAGMRTEEIAASLAMSEDQARRHTARAIVALGARTKLEAVLIALRLGLIRLPDHGR
jgi:two-component system, NarL family, nitrate/nitrite response regulator NarL